MSSKRVSYSDCLLNAVLQLTATNGLTSVLELQARAAQAQAWLHLGEALRTKGWVDLEDLMVSVGDS